MATARAEIIVSLTGAEQVATGFANIERGANAVRSALAFMRAALVTIATVEIAKRFLEQADVYTLLANRIRVLTGNLKDFKLVMEGVVLVAQATGTGLEDNGLLFTRLSRAVAGTGTTYAQVLQIVQEVGQAILISGANSVQAKQGLLQLAEGLGSGALRGRQLRSVVQDFPALADAIGAHWHVAGAALLGFALANPNILKTKDVVQALLEQVGRLNTEFQTTVPTIGQGFTRINNALIVFLGQLVNATAIGRVLTSILNIIANNISTIITLLAAFAGIVALNIIVSQFLQLGTTILTLIGFLSTLAAELGTIAGVMILIGAPIIALGFLLTANGDSFQTWATRVIILITAVGLSIKELPIILRNVTAEMANGLFADTPNSITNLLSGIAPGLKGKNFQVTQRLPILPTPTFDENLALLTQGAQLDSARGLREEGVGAGGGKLDPFLAFKNAFGNFTKIFIPNAKRTLVDVMKELGLDAPTGEGESKASEKVKGLQKAINILSSLSPLVAFIDHMKQVKEAFAKAGDAAEAFGISLSEVIDREARKFLGIGNAITNFKETILALKLAMQQEGNTITPTEALASSFNAAGSGTLQGVIDLNNHIKEVKLSQDAWKASAEDTARAIRDVTGTNTQLDQMNDTFFKLSESMKNSGLSADQMNVALRAAFGDPTPLDTYAAALEKINFQLSRGILNAKDAGIQSRDARIAFLNTQTDLSSGVERTFLQMQKSSEDVATQISTVLTDAFSNATDALVAFVNTGKLDFTSLINSIEADLLRLASNALLSELGGAFGQGSSGGSNNLIASIAGGIGGLLFGGGSSGFNALSSTNPFTFMPTFASGGSFDVSAATSMGTTSSGIDNRLIAFRANDNEQVTVSQKGERVGGVTVNMTVQTADANSFNQSHDQILAVLHRGLARANRRNN